MKKTLHLPTLGYSLARIAVLELSYVWLGSEAAGSKERALNFVWDWTPVSSTELYVVLGCRVSPSPEHADDIRVTLVADFTVEQQPAPDIESFVLDIAPQVMFPYLREAISSVTERGMSGVFHLPLVDVSRMTRVDFSFDASSGFAKLNESPELAEAYGMPVDRGSQKRSRRAKR